MYALTGITGKVGGALAEALLATGRPVRAIVRDAAKGESWKAKGCDVAIAEMEDKQALTSAFSGAEAVFILPPSEFDPEPGYPEARAVISAVRQALDAVRPKRVLCLSTIGADATEDNLLSQRKLMERALSTLTIPVTFLRPAWFMDNAAWDVASARDTGTIYSFLTPLDRSIPMVASHDVGVSAAVLIQQSWTGHRVVELEGPKDVAPQDLAAAFATVLGRPVHAETIPRDQWEAMFLAQGMRNPTPRIRMLDGFNEGFIRFTGDGDKRLRGKTTIEDVVATLTDAVP